MSSLHQDEYDFKERNNSFLKRPAAVTIRKPFLSTADMSDILTRTLRNYVPPCYMGRFSKPDQTGGLAIRAVAILYQVYDENKLAALKEKYPHYNWKASGIDEEKLRLWNEYSKTAAEIKPLVIRFDQNLVISSSPMCYLHAQYFENSNQLLGKDPKLEVFRLKPANVKSPSYGQLETATVAPLEEILDKHVVVYVFDKTDHDELNPDGTDEDYIRSTTTERLIKNQALFIDNNVPVYIGKPKMVEFWKVDEKGNGKGCVQQITKEFMLNAFGKLPLNTIMAYKWRFDVPHNVEPFVIGEQEMRDLYMTYSTSRFDKRLAELIDCILKNKHYNKEIKNFRSTLTGLYSKFINTKEQSEKLKAARKLRNWLDTTVVYKGGAIKVTGELENGTDLASRIKKGAAQFYDTVATFVSWDPCPQSRLAVIELDSYLFSYGGTVIEGSRMISDKQRADLYQGGVPFFAYDLDFWEIRKRNRDALLDRCLTRNYVTTKSTVEMSELDFRVRYYAILLNLIGEKIVKYYDFINDNVIQIPTRSSLDRCLAYKDYCTVFGKGETDVNTIGTATLEKMKSMTVKDFNSRYRKTLTKQGYKLGSESSEDDNKSVAVDFCQKMEQALFSSLGGFFITSISTGYPSVKAPMWNAAPEKTDFAAYSTEKSNNPVSDAIVDVVDQTKRNQDVMNVLTEAVVKCNNKDVSSININRVIQGISTATVKLKNDKEKYNFNRDKDSDPTNRALVCIEPMDQITIFLPDFEGKVRPVFSGFVSQVQAGDVGGFHEITLYADCNLKYLQLSRTNVKPSMSRQESENNPLTAFCVPEKMFSSIDQFLPFMFAQALTYIECQPRQLENDGKAKLFTVDPTPVYEYVKQYVNEAKTVETQSVTTKTEATSISVTDSQNKQTGSNEIKTQEVSSKESKELVSTTKESPAASVETVTRNKKAALGTYWRKVNFCDPLFNYLWYKSASKYPQTEADFMDAEQTKLTNDYVKTALASIADPVTGPKLSESKGTKNIIDILKKGDRGTYLIMKQRSKGTLTSNSSIEDREIAAVIDGTSQPSFVLQGLGLSIQFSNWKTNLEIVNDIADKLNFLCYTNNNGIVRFAPYNFDLTTLNTRDYADSKIDTGAMLLQRPSTTLDADTNPLILKRKYMTSYTKTSDETRIVNWIRLSGSWVIGGPLNLLQTIVLNPVLIKKFGVRAGRNRSVIGIENADSLLLYGLSWMDRQNKRYRSAVIRGMYDSRMDVNRPYYVQHDEIIYFCESLSINYRAGDTCTYSMGATYGKKPVVSLKSYVGSSKGDSTKYKNIFTGNVRITENERLLTAIKNKFLKENEIAPTVYAQYKHMFSGSADLCTKNAAICCYNGMLWDNVSGISFEELVYNYGWLFANKDVTGFVTSASLTSKLNQPISKLLESSGLYKKGGAGALSDEEKNAFNLFYIDIPRITDPNKLPDVFDHKSYVFTDLAVPGLVEPAKEQLMNT